jgi:ferredoxin-thioredoxin reductase catalytic subunit
VYDYKKYAQENGYIINTEVESFVIEGLKQNKEKYNEYYCPCLLMKTEDTICPCKDLRESNICHCGLYQK